ncbi:MAG: methylated-DNA--[protein]-cysteine S-methyltransferase [Natronincolaceae bacterium]|nr:methylated-DNA--[protein]-cysteine S-methyltransferase [Bacillota bacterium]NLK90550.1 methylated-DNA--[protein]-cysteine S-methyltransferase [Clostridiales bacterium]
MGNIFFYDTVIGKIGIAETNNNITNVSFVDDNMDNAQIEDIEVNETPLLKEAGKQLQQYLEGNRKDFDLPLLPVGTEFQKNVWKVLQTIPYGATLSYKQVAEKVGSPKAARAVGMANNRNPIAIIIPCHRVIGANGRLVGYGGGLHIKEYLLNMERQNI